jgi:hypothetical protein
MNSSPALQRDTRQFQLLRRLLLLGARTPMISAFTGITQHRVSLWRRRWNLPDDVIHRGPLPNSFTAILRSSVLRTEAAAFLVVMQTTHPLLLRSSVRYSLDAGEQLCEALEAFDAFVPHRTLSFEQCLLIARGTATGDRVASESCERCSATIIIDPMGEGTRRCRLCIGFHTRSSMQPLRRATA